MKKISTLGLTILFALFSVISYGQSQRMVLVEEATQASCPPCATQNPPLQALLGNNTDKSIFIGYQVWWPGVDAMYEDNPTEVQSRIINDYYTSITGAPNIIVQGSSSAQSVGYLTQSVIDNIYADESEFDMDISAEILNGQLIINGSATATAAVTGDLRLRLVITEHLIVNADLAFIGTNGETEFHDVFKKFVNGPEGITLSNDWAIGDTYEIDETFDLSTLNIYNYDQVNVVAMIQNDDDKFIHQAAKAADLEITVSAINNAGVSSIAGLPDNVCSGTQELAAEFNLQNNGNDELTSATITYNINGGTDATYDWTGSLTTFQKETIQLPAISFDAEPINIVNISVTNPNGMTDEDPADDNTSSTGVPLALVGIDSVNVEIFTDNYGDETYWEIRDGNEEVVAWGGNPNVGLTNIGTGQFPPPADPAMYANATLYNTIVPIDQADCFTFHITDYYGDGMSLSALPAYYKVMDGDGVELYGGGNESFTEVQGNFEGDVFVAIEDIVEVNSVSIFPNPVKSSTAVNFELINQANASIVVTNTMGQNVFVKDLGSLTSGVHTENIDMSSLSNGFYLVQIKLNNELITKKITVAK